MTIQTTRMRRGELGGFPIEDAGGAGLVALLIYAIRMFRRCYYLNVFKTVSPSFSARDNCAAWCPGSALDLPVAAIRLDGGRLCLDFVNTIHDRDAADAEDYVCQRAAVYRMVRATRRRDRLAQHIAAPEAAGQRAALMRKVRTLRHYLHALLTSRIDGVPPPADAVRCLDAVATSRRGQSICLDVMADALAGCQQCVAATQTHRARCVGLDQRSLCVAASPLRQHEVVRLVVRRDQQEPTPPLVRDGNLRHGAVKMKRYRRSHA